MGLVMETLIYMASGPGGVSYAQGDSHWSKSLLVMGLGWAFDTVLTRCEGR